MPRDDLQATLEARQELGREFEPELVEAFARRLEERLEARAGERLPARRDPSQNTAITIVSLLVAIPLLGIAGATVGVPGVALVAVALVLINYFVHR